MPGYPILYSFRRCPYAIRARMALKYSGIAVHLREVELKNKPAQMLEISPKGTVPVLHCSANEVIDESLDIMYWALAQNDPQGWTPDASSEQAASALIEENDCRFKPLLDRYKYADRYPGHSAEEYRDQAAPYLQALESRLSKHAYLLGGHTSTADVALFPFVRQFAFVDKVWFDRCEYAHLRRWLDGFLQSELFNQIMQKYPPWSADTSNSVLL